MEVPLDNWLSRDKHRPRRGWTPELGLEQQREGAAAKAKNVAGAPFGGSPELGLIVAKAPQR